MTKRRKRRGSPTGLVWRKGRAYFDRRHERFHGGRLALSLRTADPDEAHERHGALTQLMSRGDWGVLEAIRSGDLHITDALAALRDGNPRKLQRLGAESPRLGKAASRFLQRTEATLRGATQKKYASVVGMLLEEFEGDQPMGDLTVQEAEEWLHADKETAGGEPWSPATQQLVRTVAGSLWDMVMREERDEELRKGVHRSIALNPWREAAGPRVDRTRFAWLTPEEWGDLSGRMEGRRAHALLACAFLAGLRRSEILHLRTSVDLELGDNPLIRVQSRGGEHPWKPKTRRSERDVPIPEALARILRAHIESGQAGDRYLIRLPGKDQPLGTDAARIWTRDAYRDAGIKYGREGDGLTLHSGRHSYATWLALDGVPFHVIAQLLGDTVETVMATYIHHAPTNIRAAVEKIEARVKQSLKVSIRPHPGD